MIVVWRVTTHCNLNCGFCLYATDQSIRRTSIDAGQAMRFAGVLHEYQRSSGDSVLVSWLGGEPLLWPAIYDVSRALRQELGLRVGVTTNGTALCSSDAITRASECFDEITLSIDGSAATHNRLRSWSGGFEKLRTVIARLRTLSTPPFIRVNTVLMRDTLPHFADLCATLAQWGVDEITFNQLGGNDRPEFHREQRLTPADVVQLGRTLPALRAELAGANVRLSGSSRYLQRFHASAIGERLSVDDCGPAEDFLFVDECGRVAPCSFTIDDYAVPLESIDTSAALTELRTLYRKRIQQQRSSWCRDCPSTRIFNKFAA